jgi:hypothetical protein
VSVPPQNPKIYHITHLQNLPQIADGTLWSDAERIRQSLACEVVGMAEIKRRRLEELQVSCHPGTYVGEYVPFYFCFRSVMLYLLYRSNHPQLTYREGQRPILHLEADFHSTVRWAEENGRRWAFSNGNAGTRYTTSFYADVSQLEVLDWKSIAATDWRDPFVEERKQSEFLVEQSFPWNLVERIGVFDDAMAASVNAALAAVEHKPQVAVMKNWYY